uniref:Uncharacterized protein n=1 Tax=Rhizophora mucronata TaxID=61149 RepID=A0A2P2PE92_RHIMU
MPSCIKNLELCNFYAKSA